MSLLIVAGAFLTVLFLLLGAYDLYRMISGMGAERVRERLKEQAAAGEKEAAVELLLKEGMDEEPLFSGILGKFAPVESLKRLLQQANSEMPVGVFLLLSMLLGVLGLGLSFYVGVGPLGLLVGTAMGGSLPYMYQARRKTQRLKAIEAQLPDALDLIARTLLAGHAFIMGLKMVGDQLEEPLSSEFKKTFDEISFGVSVQQAMKDLSERIDSVDIRFFVTALLVQLETGGNLAEIIGSISTLIRSRFELFGKIKALSAEGRISAVIMFGLPFFVGAGLYFINPDYLMLLYTDELGRSMVTGGAVMMVVGMYVTNRMIKIKV